MSDASDISPLEKEALGNLALALIVWNEAKKGEGAKMAREAMGVIRETPKLDDVMFPTNDFDEGFALGVFCVLCDLEHYRERKAFVDLANGGK